MSISAKEIIRFINFEELFLWWLSVILVVISIVFYLVTTLSPWREIFVLVAIVFFIFMTAWKFFK